MTTATAEYYLNKWGVYIATNRAEFLGYPRRNVIHRMIHEGPGAGQATAPIEYSPPIEVKVVDNIIPVLPQALQDILFLAFVHKVPVRKGGAVMGVTKSRYAEMVKQAVQRVAGNIDQLEKYRPARKKCLTGDCPDIISDF